MATATFSASSSRASVPPAMKAWYAFYDECRCAGISKRILLRCLHEAWNVATSLLSAKPVFHDHSCKRGIDLLQNIRHTYDYFNFLPFIPYWVKFDPSQTYPGGDGCEAVDLGCTPAASEIPPAQVCSSSENERHKRELLGVCALLFKWMKVSISQLPRPSCVVQDPLLCYCRANALVGCIPLAVVILCSLQGCSA
jgi:hypothetical protein